MANIGPTKISLRLTVDQSVLDKYDITLEEFLLLYINSKGVNINECTESLLAKGLADKDLFKEGSLILSDNMKELVSSILIDSDSKVIDKEDEYIALATELRELYPKGKKEGTTYLWRGSVAEIAKKLKTLVVKYGCKFTKEQAISATKEYVKSFNGNYTKMRLLKYFIVKLDKDFDGNINFVSEMMSIIENEDDLDTNNDNWRVSVR